MEYYDAAYEAHMAAMEEEQRQLDKIPPVKGHRAVDLNGSCEQCNTVGTVYDLTACTLGYPGHPGAEFTSFHVCKECLEG